MSTTPTKLTAEEREKEFAKIPEWKTVANGRDAIERHFKFADFKQAWAFMSKVADHAEKMNHHPEWYQKNLLIL